MIKVEMKKIILITSVIIFFACGSKEFIQNHINKLEKESSELQLHSYLNIYGKSVENLEASQQKLADLNQLLDKARKTNFTINILELEAKLEGVIVREKFAIKREEIFKIKHDSIMTLINRKQDSFNILRKKLKFN